ncbi:MAG: hypothetical protein PHE73_08840 [Sulfurovaceae bacterium]|nr:hypothetical protein [Sulfurovaceae bacterium]
MRIGSIKGPSVKKTRYTVKGARLKSFKSPSVGSLKSVTKLSGGLKAGKKFSARIANPLKIKAHL